MSTVHRFERNTQGRDFAVGDLHGCVKTLDALLEKIHFDDSKDRLFLAGDLVDRGPDSLGALSLLRYSWAHAIRGNHEDFITQSLADPAWAEDHIKNGGEWFRALSQEAKEAVGQVIAAMPFVIEIETAFGKVGLAHAGVWKDWNEHVACWECVGEISRTLRKELWHRTLWTRTRIKTLDATPVEGIDLVIVGHTPVQQVGMLGNVLYLDSGCGATHVPRSWVDAGWEPSLTAVELSQPLRFHSQVRLDPLEVVIEEPRHG